MGIFKLRKKVIEPQIHESEDNLSLTEGAHILIGCKRVALSGNAVVLETTDSTYTTISGKSKIRVMHSGDIYMVTQNAFIGLIEEGSINIVSGNAKIDTINNCNIDYLSKNARNQQKKSNI